jgi:RNA polymerase sigma-70 factor (ECF subfamily)
MGSPTTSFGLLERIREGDRAAFDLLFEKYRRRLAILIYYKLGSQLRRTADVDDILQDTLLRAFRGIDTFHYRAPGSFLSWLSRIAEHVLVDTARFEGRERRNAGEIVRFRSKSNPAGPEPADSHTPSRILAENEEYSSLLARLDSLPEQYREVILLAKVEGLATAEVAERLGKSREATALLLHRAVARFRGILEVES